ncbi:UbiA family prenyltransferase [[Eubacterium] cellulosolvens]
MSGVLKLIRPINCFMGVLGVLIGAMVGVGLDAFGSEHLFKVLLGCVIVYFFMVAGNMMNDYFDRDLDKINHPQRPIPAGELMAKDVISSAALIYVFLIILGLMVNYMMLIILIIALILMVGYEVSLKRRGFVGNISISILVGLLFMFGAAAVQRFDVVIFLSLLAFLATLTREIVKDIEDIKGDVDRETLPKRVGIKPAGVVAGVALVIAIILSPIPVYPEVLPMFELNKLSIYYLYLIIPADIIFILSMVYFIKNPRVASLGLKGGMAIALLAFAIGGILV